MFSKIIEAEHHLNYLLPLSRHVQIPTAELRASALVWSQLVWDAAAKLGPIPLSDEQLEKGSNLAQFPVFICGVHRSGTTLVRDLLDAHPSLVVLPSEGTFYTNLEHKLKAVAENEQAAFLGKEWIRRLANPINQPPYWMLARSTTSGSPYVNFARYILSWWQVVNQKKGTQWPHTVIVLAYASCTGNLSSKFWVDKTPGNERFLGRLWQEMPGAKIIHVIRDPVATLASRKKIDSIFSLRKALPELKLSFTIAVEQSLSNDPRFLLLRYEDLCEEPATMIKRMASFLKIDVSNILSEPTVAGLPSQANSSFNKDTPAGQILKSNQHTQQSLLNPTELRLVAAYLGNLSKKLHYPLAQPGVLHQFFIKLKHRLL